MSTSPHDENIPGPVAQVTLDATTGSATTPDPDPYPLRYIALSPGLMESVVLERLARIEAKLDLLRHSKDVGFT